MVLFQPPIPPKYSKLTEAEMCERIAALKRDLGRRVVILGHHYQQDDVIQFADFTGDSLKLSQLAAQQTEAEFIVFCGVHFMAESADILTSDRQQVILPDLSAGCSMADMADIEAAEVAWDHLTRHSDIPITPVTYVNSSAAVKAFVGRNNGACCTSSNARMVLEWALHGATPDGECAAPGACGAAGAFGEHGACGAGLQPVGEAGFQPARAAGVQPAGAAGSKPAPQETGFKPAPQNAVGHKVLFLPDQHLGRNTAYALGWPLESMVVYDWRQPEGGLTPEQIRDARIILWKGHCSVHQLFNVQQVDALRARPEPWQVLVHPECSWEVVQKADLCGSTEYIIRTVRDAAPGTYWAIGTEVHLINRLATQFPDKHVRSVAGIQCLCTTMYRIDLRHLLYALDNIAEGRPVNRISVDEETKRWSRIALERMLALRPSQPVSAK